MKKRRSRINLTYRDLLIFFVGLMVGIGADVLLEPEWLNLSTVRPSIIAPSPQPAYSSKQLPPLTLASNQVVTCFTPTEKCAPRLIQLVSNAKERIDMRIYTFTSKAITEALIAAKGRGIKIRVLCDGEQRKSAYSRIKNLEQAGIEVKVEKVSGLAHNKVMILDQELLVTGSYNFTQAAETRNAENMLIIRHKELVVQYRQDFEKAWKQ